MQLVWGLYLFAVIAVALTQLEVWWQSRAREIELKKEWEMVSKLAPREQVAYKIQMIAQELLQKIE